MAFCIMLQLRIIKMHNQLCTFKKSCKPEFISRLLTQLCHECPKCGLQHTVLFATQILRSSLCSVVYFPCLREKFPWVFPCIKLGTWTLPFYYFLLFIPCLVYNAFHHYFLFTLVLYFKSYLHFELLLDFENFVLFSNIFTQN